MAETTSGVLALRVTEGFLNDLAAAGVGEGIQPPPFVNTFQLPMMGPIEMSVGMTIVSVSFVMSPDHNGALIGTVRARGVIEILGESPMPALPGAVVVRADVAVSPRIGFHPDGSFEAVLDLESSELIAMELEEIEGLGHDQQGQLQMLQMMFAAMGGDLFGGLAVHLDSVGITLDADDAEVLRSIGAAPERAVVEVGEHELTVVLPARPPHHGGVTPPVAGPGGFGLAISSGALGPLTALAAAATAPGPLPIEFGLRTDGSELGTSIRSVRLVDSSLLPDLRATVRTRLEPRLSGDQIEIRLRSAWVDLPGVPSVLSGFGRRLGGVVGLLPGAVRLPRRVRVPARPGGDERIELRIEALIVTDAGVSVSVEMEPS